LNSLVFLAGARAPLPRKAPGTASTRSPEVGGAAPPDESVIGTVAAIGVAVSLFRLLRPGVQQRELKVQLGPYNGSPRRIHMRQDNGPIPPSPEERSAISLEKLRERGKIIKMFREYHETRDAFVKAVAEKKKKKREIVENANNLPPDDVKRQVASINKEIRKLNKPDLPDIPEDVKDQVFWESYPVQPVHDQANNLMWHPDMDEKEGKFAPPKKPRLGPLNGGPRGGFRISGAPGRPASPRFMNSSYRSRWERRFRKRIVIRSKLEGNSVRPRLAVFRAKHHMHALVVDDTVGNGVVKVHSTTKQKHNYDEVEKTFADQPKVKVKPGERTYTMGAAEIIGRDIAKRCLEHDPPITKVVFDRGGFKYAGRVKALAEAARAGGLQF